MQYILRRVTWRGHSIVNGRCTSQDRLRGYWLFLQIGDMERRIIFYLHCGCGKRGSIVEWCGPQRGTGNLDQSRFLLRGLSHEGEYCGNNEVFARLKPACQNCGQTMGPASVIGVSELGQMAVIAPGSHRRGRDPCAEG